MADATSTETPMERAAQALLPEVGSQWVWEPLAPHATQAVRVTEVRWVGDEWMIESELVGGGGRYWNDLDRWIEATVLVAPAED